MRSSWKCRPVIKNTTYHQTTTTSAYTNDRKGIKKSQLTKFFGVVTFIPYYLPVTSTLLSASTPLCAFILFDCWMMPFGIRYHGNQPCLLLIVNWAVHQAGLYQHSHDTNLSFRPEWYNLKKSYFDVTFWIMFQQVSLSYRLSHWRDEQSIEPPVLRQAVCIKAGSEYI